MAVISGSGLYDATIPNMQAWYLIHTKPQQEYLARDNLERQGYEVYLPLTTVLRRRRGRSIPAQGPVFPRYLFIHLSDESDNWKPIRSTLGVQCLVRFGERPARVPDELIDTLRSRETEDGLLPAANTEPEPGESVRISHGPFEGYTAIFESRSGKERVFLLLQIAENNVRLEAERSAIEKA